MWVTCSDKVERSMGHIDETGTSFWRFQKIFYRNKIEPWTFNSSLDSIYLAGPYIWMMVVFPIGWWPGGSNMVLQNIVVNLYYGYTYDSTDFTC